MADPRVIVVGAGPAGVRAAETLAGAGVRPVLVEEGRRDGGQIYRRQPEGFGRPYASLYGTEAARAVDLHGSFQALRGRIDYRPGTVAWGLWERRLQVHSGDRSEELEFDALIICSGATDRVMPVPGWTRPGVYTLGAAQIALKAQASGVGRRIAFLGTGPLLYLVAAQYAYAGASVAAVLDTSPLGLRLRALPKLLARPGVLMKGAALVSRLRRAGVAARTGVAPVAIDGDDNGVRAVRVRTSRGRTETIECDAVALGYHLRPETQLADLARCEFGFDPATRQWLPRTDADGRSSVDGIYLAGDGARIRGADAAEISGRLAALAVLSDAGRGGLEAEMAPLRARLARFGRFADGLAAAFPWPAAAAAGLPDETVICRCEAITAGELRAAAGAKGAPELNRAKAFSRAGMGRCQGRYCGHAAAEVLAAATGQAVEQVGRLRGQAPVKPLPISTDCVEPAA